MIRQLPTWQVASRIACAGACLAILEAGYRSSTRAPVACQIETVTHVAVEHASMPHTCALRGTPQERIEPRLTSHHAHRLGLHPIGLSGDGQPHDRALPSKPSFAARIP
jgi:hypothetical protein